MSLNWKEIDAIISEWNFIGGRIQQVLQPTLQTLFFEIYTKNQDIYKHNNITDETQTLAFLSVSFKNQEVSIYQSSHRERKPKKAQRFQQLLQARLIGAKIINIEHINQDRIIKISFEKTHYDTQAPSMLFLHLRLWNNQANGILCNADNSIIDLVYRRPNQTLMPGEQFIFPTKTANEKTTTIRDWDNETFASFNAFIAYNHTHSSDESKKESKETSLKRALEKQLHIQTQSLSKGQAQLQTYHHAIKVEMYGNSILANIHLISKGQTTLEIRKNNETLIIPLSSTLTPIENAERYFNQSKKAARSLQILEQQNLDIQHTISQLHEIQTRFCEDNFQLSDAEIGILFPLASHTPTSTNTKTTKSYEIKILLQDRDMTIMVGRNRKENDHLLRKHVNGNDMWLHIRGNSGAFVFIKSPKKKTIPLETLIICGQLAALYSKVKNESYADVYYTEVKHLKRVKNSPGLVIPVRSKNLQIKIDTQVAKTYLKAHGTKNN